MIQKDVTIINKLGLHARAAAKFVTRASGFESEILVTRNQQEVNGKSIMGVMMLAASQGTIVTLQATGADEEKAVEMLEQLVSNRFGEDQ